MQVLVKVLVKTLALRLAEVKAKTVSDTLDHVKTKALVNKFALTLAEMKAKTTGGIRVMWRAKGWWTGRLTRYRK